ncbi:MAG: cytochrome-c peroxidase [Gemmatimonadaceae bacterium]|nr:cytochrome-c peroxidase [Gemmatimonadaceae bacterium]
MPAIAVALLLATPAFFGPAVQGPVPRKAHEGFHAARVALGRALFAEPLLSRDSTLSCATCHDPRHAFAEPRAVSAGIGVDARRRNAPSLVNATVFRTTFDWDGRATSLAHQLSFVFSEAGDMGITAPEAAARLRARTDYRRHFRAAYGRMPQAKDLLDALTTFESTLVTTGSRFERFYLGAEPLLSDSEHRGWRLFRSNRTGCSGCHLPLPDPMGSGIIAFHDGRFHNIGVGYADSIMLDAGRYEVTGNRRDWGAFRTPSLWNIGVTAPYMHDGSLPTLAAVIKFYSNGGVANPNLDPVVRPIDLSVSEMEDLEAFLMTLTNDWQSLWPTPARDSAIGTHIAHPHALGLHFFPRRFR